MNDTPHPLDNSLPPLPLPSLLPSEADAGGLLCRRVL